MSNSAINTWKSIMNTGNHRGLINIIHDNATFHSPVVFTPQEGKKKVIKYLSCAVGIDFIKCENNLIKEFKVFLRPVKGIEVVWKEMKKKLVQYDSNLSQ